MLWYFISTCKTVQHISQLYIYFLQYIKHYVQEFFFEKGLNPVFMKSNRRVLVTIEFRHVITRLVVRGQLLNETMF